MYNIFFAFLKVGLIGFGGGSALMPVVEKEIVRSKGWVAQEQYIKHAVVSNLTPGALPPKLGAMIGYELGGAAGSLAGSYGVTLPGVLLTLLILLLFSLIGDQALRVIECLSVGITAFIIYLLMHFVLHTLRSSSNSPGLLPGCAICLVAFLVTGERRISQLLAMFAGSTSQIARTPLFAISTIQLILSAMFIIVFVSLLRGIAWAVTACMISGLYILSVGKSHLIPAWASTPLLVVMVSMIIAAFAFARCRKKTEYKPVMVIPKKIVAAIIAQASVPILLFVVCLLYGFFARIGDYNITEFTADTAISTVTSFGGGEAYVSVADGIFVGNDYISPEVFYRQNLPVANALPGPILVKLAASVGFTYGSAQGNFGMGLLTALYIMTLTIGLSSIVSLILFAGYDALGDSRIVRNLRLFILPVICGMLITTSLNMAIEAVKVFDSAGYPAVPSFMILLLGIAMLGLFKMKYRKVPDIVSILACALISGVGLWGR